MSISLDNLQGMVALVVGIFVLISPKLAVQLIGIYLIFVGLVGLGVVRF